MTLHRGSGGGPTCLPDDDTLPPQPPPSPQFGEGGTCRLDGEIFIPMEIWVYVIEGAEGTVPQPNVLNDACKFTIFQYVVYSILASLLMRDRKAEAEFIWQFDPLVPVAHLVHSVQVASALSGSSFQIVLNGHATAFG